FERLLETYLACAPRGFRSFLKAMPVWVKEKLFLKDLLRKELSQALDLPRKALPPLLFSEHHLSHAASAFFPSPFRKAAVLCLDGVGEWATTSVWRGEDNRLEPLWQLDFPHSLGLLYSAFTYYAGFRVNSGEYKLMGLAPYGEPRYVDLILDELLDLKADGSFRLNLDYFDFPTGLRMTSRRFHDLFGGPPRIPESPIRQKDMDIACSIQRVTEEIVLRLARTLHRETCLDRLCLAGGVALNCVANGRLLREGPFDSVWIQPAAGDAGGALGAALAVWHHYLEGERPAPTDDAMQGARLGPAYGMDEITARLDTLGAVYAVLDEARLYDEVAARLAQDQVIGWFQGRMEFGPRALGGRSILGSPLGAEMQSRMNLKIKYRESFRPFAPAVKHDQVADWFEFEGASPYMLFTAQVAAHRRLPLDEEALGAIGLERLRLQRSEIPAVTHVDGSARLQTVHPDTDPRFYHLLDAFERRTGCPVLVNTSFNVRGEPIVATPEDAYRCFMRTDMDCLVLENALLLKVDQPPWREDGDWKKAHALD
ncbi:carbamoyltransferase family protein, partial [Thiohalobacter sp.]|uniref:carbamoyltransferase family protein n=1 Tax=Thiohalobacter sp. TaxID=2025948 RepID=UPI00260E0383